MHKAKTEPKNITINLYKGEQQMLFDSIKRQVLNVQNSMDKVCDIVGEGTSPTKSYDEIGSTDNSKGCGSDNNEAKASINIDTLPRPTMKSPIELYRKSISKVYDRIFDIGEDIDPKLKEEKKETQTHETLKKEETKETQPKEEKQNIITIKVISPENR